MQEKNGLILSDIEKLYPVFYKEPEDVRDILLNCVREALESYDWTKGLVRDTKVDDSDKVHCDIILPRLDEAASYKNYGLRHYPFDIYVQTYYGKEFWIEVDVVCNENHNNRICNIVDGYERTIIASSWIEPLGISVTRCISRKCDGWNPSESEVK